MHYYLPDVFPVSVNLLKTLSKLHKTCAATDEVTASKFDTQLSILIDVFYEGMLLASLFVFISKQLHVLMSLF